MDSSPHQQCSKQEDERGVAVGVGSDSISGLSNNGRKITRQDVKMVQNLIERCLQLYMNKNDVVNMLSDQARIEPGFTSLVWQKLEQENVEFFKAYNVRLTLKEQIDRFNQLLVRQCQLMHYPAAQDFPSHHNGAAQMSVTGLPAETSILQQQSGISSTCHPQMHQVSSLSDSQVVNGFPASESYHQLHLNASREMTVDGHLTMTTIPIASEVAGGPASVTSNARFSLGAVEMAGFSNLDCLPPNSSYAAHMDMMPHHLQGGADGGGDYRGMPLHSFTNIPWNLSFPDLGADLASIGDHGQMENYSGSDILLDSAAEEENDMVKEFFADSVPPSSPQIEEKPDVAAL